MKHLLHLGLALALVGLFVGKCGPKFGWFPAPGELVMAEGDRAEVDERTVLYLDRFDVIRYPSGKIRQYVSDVKVLDTVSKSLSAASVSVNHPLRVNGWWIYQYGYGPDQTGVMCTQLRCVKDGGLPVAALGGALLLLGTFGLCLRGFEVSMFRSFNLASFTRVKGRLFNLSTLQLFNLSTLQTLLATLVVALPIFIIGRAVLRPEPVPALQSWLMAPHVAAYAASYLILLFAAFGIGRRFVPLGFFLMTLGLVLGAVWGKMAWSEWWQFDPKENWSFVTWLAFAAFFHCRADSRLAAWLLRLGAVLILVTLTWVNFSRALSGLHSYA